MLTSKDFKKSYKKGHAFKCNCWHCRKTSTFNATIAHVLQKYDVFPKKKIEDKED